MDEKNAQVQNDDQVESASKSSLGCMIGAIIGIILVLAVIVTAVIVFVLSLFSNDNMFSDWDFGFIDDVNNYLAESFNDDGVDGDGISAKVAGLHVVINDYYYDDIGMSEMKSSGDEVFIIDFTIANEDRDHYALTPSAFHLEIDGQNAYPYYDGSNRINDESSTTSDYRDYLLEDEAGSYLIVFEIPSYIDFNQDKTLVFSHYLDGEEASFELPH